MKTCWWAFHFSAIRKCTRYYKTVLFWYLRAYPICACSCFLFFINCQKCFAQIGLWYINITIIAFGTVLFMSVLLWCSLMGCIIDPSQYQFYIPVVFKSIYSTCLHMPQMLAVLLVVYDTHDMNHAINDTWCRRWILVWQVLIWLNFWSGLN